MSDRLALIIANSEFDDPKLSRLVTPSRDAEALAEVLGDPAIGGFEVTLLVDETEPVVSRGIARLYHRRKRGDLLLLYYSGHGIKDEYSGELYLATRDTEMDIASATAIGAAFVRGQIDKSGSRRNVVVLDCCHSGAFAEGKAALGSSAGTREAFAGNGYGRVILTASNALEFAWQGDELLGEVEKSVFTHFLVEGLQTGAADLDGNGQISLDELYEYVHEQVIANSKQTPQKSVLKVEGQVIIAQNPHPVAKPAALVAPPENLATQLLERVPSMVTDNITGGGSMTATALAQAIVNEGLKRIATGSNPTLLKRGILTGAGAVVGAIFNQAIELTTKEEIANVAAVSAQDREIGDLIADVMDKVGKDGFITVVESSGGWFETEYVEGMNFDHGYVSDYFLTNPEWDEAVIEAPYILIHDKRISEAQDLAPILEKLVQKGERNLVVIAEDVDGDALGTLVQSKLHGDMNVLAVRAPGVGDHRRAVLRDIAILTGSTVISEETGLELKSAHINHLGRADKVVSTKHDTTIIGGWGDIAAIRGRISQIRAEIENSTSDDKEKLQERLANLTGGKALIRVPGATKAEREEKKREVENALTAVCAAVEEGIVPGGGVALINAVDSLDEVKMDSEDENIGVAILRRALEAPLKKIAADAGQDGALVVGEVRRRQKETKNDHVGYDVTSGKYRDMMEAGITDSARVIRRALEIAVSIAATIFNELHATRRAKPLS
jgi:chaperonin GroEL